jgi:hypothetical protein
MPPTARSWLCACDHKLSDPCGWLSAWIVSEIMISAIGDTPAASEQWRKRAAALPI